MKKLRNFVVAAAATTGLMLGGLTFAAPAAHADDPTDKQSTETVTNPVDVDADSKRAQELEAQEADGDYDFELDLDFQDAGEVSAEFNYFHKSLITAEGKRVLGPLKGDGGNRHWKTADAKRCPLLSVYPTDQRLKTLQRTFFIKKGVALTKFKRNVMSEKVVKKFADGRQKLSVLCFQIPDGAHFPDTGKDFNGNQHGFDNVVRGPPMLFEVTLRTVRDNGQVVEKLVPTRRGQDKDHDGKVDEGDCWNPKANIVKFQLAEVEYTNSYFWRGTGDTIARVHAEGEATISQGACSFTLNFDFFAQGTAGFDVIVKGRTEIEARGAAVRVLDKTTVRANARANAEASVKATLRASFNDACDEEQTYDAPVVSANASACVEPGQADGIVTVTATNNNDVAVPATFKFPGKPDQTATIAANATVSKQFMGIAPGSYTGSVSFGAPVNKSAPYSVTVEECDTPVNNRPVGEIVQWPAHLEPNEYYRVKVVGSDPEDGGAVDLIYSVGGGAQIVVGDINHPTICDVEGSQKVCTFWIKANASVGVEYEINLRVRDGSGLTSPLYTKTGMVQNMPV